MKNTKKFGAALLTVLAIASAITPHASATVTDFTSSSVSVSTNTLLVWIITQSDDPINIGDKINLSISAVGINTVDYGGIHMLEINGTSGWYNHTKDSWSPIVSSPSPIWYMNATYMGGIYSDIFWYLVIPIPVNLTWVNSSITGISTFSGTTLNKTMGPITNSYTYNSAGIASTWIQYNSTHHIQQKYELEEEPPNGGGGPGGEPNIPFGVFYIGFIAIAIIGIVIISIKKRKVLIK